MASDSSKPNKKRQLKKTETVREKTAKKNEPKKVRKIQKARGAVSRPIVAARNVGRREYHIIKPKEDGSKLHRFFTKSRASTPSYFRNSWQELKQVTWPSRGETWRLTFAVFIFSIGLGLIVAGLDWGLQRLFREIIIG